MGDSGNTLGKLKQEAELLLKQTEKKELQPKALDKKLDQASKQGENTGKEVLENPQEAQQKVDELFSKLFSENDSTFNAVDKEALVNVVKKQNRKKPGRI